jgi:hypothetical protein
MTRENKAMTCRKSYQLNNNTTLYHNKADNP